MSKLTTPSKEIFDSPYPGAERNRTLTDYSISGYPAPNLSASEGYCHPSLQGIKWSIYSVTGLNNVFRKALTRGKCDKASSRLRPQQPRSKIHRSNSQITPILQEQTFTALINPSMETMKGPYPSFSYLFISSLEFHIVALSMRLEL